MKIQIRHSTINDQPDIFNICYRGWLEAYSHIFGEETIHAEFKNRQNDPEYVSQKINEIKTNPDHYVATIDETVVAVMILDHITSEKDYAEILCFYVNPDLQRFGIGKTLFNYAKEIAVSNNKHKIHLEALKENHIGCSFYKKHGGEIIEESTKIHCGIDTKCVVFKFNI